MKRHLCFVIMIIACSCVHNSDPIKEENWVGVIVEKDRNWDNHGAPYVKISLEDGISEEIPLLMWEEGNEMWYFISLGDSMIKHKGELDVVIKKPSGVYKKFKYPINSNVISVQK